MSQFSLPPLASNLGLLPSSQPGNKKSAPGPPPLHASMATPSPLLGLCSVATFREPLAHEGDIASLSRW
ncbi:hypothetical protein JMJ77_0013385 [Colletotrichum scovillei]|uniref:Uncharacterized protein n=1 Tax=Colletotrichum scovillei TaxID=1209932 RepID=A0A9P7UFF8_9PEZI|nr:hypothetical protein JMJ77_0013385 [Colletotrichum scovillei]